MYQFKRPRKTLVCEDTSTAIDLAKLDEDQLYTWLERVAICVVHGGLSETRARSIAWEQIHRMREA